MHKLKTKIDLHLHTTASDGTLSPIELLKAAKQCQIGIIAITDHDTIKGFEIARKHAAQYDVTLVSGVEISSKYRNGTLHILGYGIDTSSEFLHKKLQFCQQQRKQRNLKIIKKLQNMGIDITIADMDNRAKDVFSLGRPHIASSLLEKGVVTSMQEAFDRYLGTDGSAFVSKEVFTAKESIEIIKKSNGLAFIAHPVTLNREENELKIFIESLKNDGLDGIEIYSSYHQKKQINYFKNLSIELGLKVSAGSDFHGANKPNIAIGLSNEGNYVTLDQISEGII